MRASSVWAIGLLSLLVLIAPAAWAHSGGVRYVDARLAAGGPSLTVRVGAEATAAQVGIGPELDSFELEESAAEVAPWLVEGLEVTAGGVACTRTLGEPRAVDGADGRFAAVDATFECGDGAVTILDHSLAGADAGHRTIVAFEGAVHILGGADDRLTLSEPATTAQVVWAFLVEGVIHLVTGYDHVLFLLSLLFAAGVVARRRGTRIAGLEVAKVVTAFTIGHSITLVLASLGVVALNLQLVETIIAASIVAVAGLNVLRPEASVGRPAIALGFGLVHGFGFSSVLAEVGLPQGERAAALFSFNLGIELAQLAVVAIAIVPLAWLASHEKLYRAAVMRGGSLAIAGVASVWVVQRALGL
ncbi:MAG: HupE/UreJ family protein [Polyangiaceae bacterium]